VRAIRDALVAKGFDVFWDREAPAGRSRNEWTRQQAGAAACVVVFWSANSAMQFAVAHEAIAAKTSGKLISVLLEQIEPSRLPMKLDPGLGDIVIDPGNSTAGLDRLAREIEARKRQAANPPRADAGPAGSLAKWANAASYIVWYTLTTILLLYLVFSNGVWVYAAGVALFEVGFSDPVWAMALTKVFINGGILAACLYFLWNRLMWLLGRREW
jgi:hypothetical protein